MTDSTQPPEQAENILILTFANGTKIWTKDSKEHREDGPAIEHADGSKAWKLNGKLHRLDGPAIEEADGSKVWLIEGKKHREDGPAEEKADGTKIWFLKGELCRMELKNGNQSWFTNRQLDRKDGPAFISGGGDRFWYQAGQFHREDGPAKLWTNGNEEFFLEGVQVDESEYKKKCSILARKKLIRRQWLNLRICWVMILLTWGYLSAAVNVASFFARYHFWRLVAPSGPRNY